MSNETTRTKMIVSKQERSVLEIARAIRRLSSGYYSTKIATVQAALILAGMSTEARKLDP